jgi:hypothetical protein
VRDMADRIGKKLGDSQGVSAAEFSRGPRAFIIEPMSGPSSRISPARGIWLSALKQPFIAASKGDSIRGELGLRSRYSGAMQARVAILAACSETGPKRAGKRY